MSNTILPDRLPALEHSLADMHGHYDAVSQALDKLAIQIEALLRERAHIIETLSTFYRADVSMSSLQPVLDLCCELNPSLREGR